MPSNFPGSADTITNNVANTTPQVNQHPSLHNQIADAVMAIETALLPGGAMNLAAHTAAADPHAIYLTQTEGDVRYSAIGTATVADGSITSAKIADGTIVAGDIADGAVTSAKILDGTIATADLANAAVTNAKQGTDTARYSLLVNGGFEQWQRGVGPFTTNVYSADRWLSTIGAGATLTVTKETTTIDGLGLASAKAVYVHGGTATIFSQDLEAARNYQSRVVSFSCRVQTSTANAVRLSIGDGAATFSAYHTGGGAWETLTLTKTINAAVGATMALRVNLEASCTAYLDNAMLVVGSVAADYAPLHPADDLSRCLRYYEVIGDGSTGYPRIFGWAGGTHNLGIPLAFKAEKAVTPTTTKIGTWTVTNCAQPILPGTSTKGGTTLIAVSSGVGAVSCDPAAGCSVTIEGNP